MITSNVIERVFKIKNKLQTGTCFTIEHDNKQYFVTAQHVIKDIKDGDKIEIYHDKTWKELTPSIIGHHSKQDISVFAINEYIFAHPLEPTAKEIVYGQDLYFLGFPYGLGDDTNSKINRSFPLPLVKKGILSAIIFNENEKYLLLDGINNPGFSGGPVVFRENNNSAFKVAGVISGYRSAAEPVYINNQKQRHIFYRANTGIVIAPMIENAIELIEQNPVGYKI